MLESINLHKGSILHSSDGRFLLHKQGLLWKMKLLHATLVVLGLSLVDARPSEGSPFCHDLECPKFDTINKTDKYELRCYPTGYQWVSTIVAGFKYDEAVRLGFSRLFDYIQGENAKKEKIPMTAPVAVDIQPGQGPFCKNNFIVNFFVPFELQGNAPAPSDKEVFLSNIHPFCTYVIVYGGYSNIDTIQKYSKQLDEALVKDGLGESFRKDIFLFAGYDSPFRFLDRHNEIWFIKKNGASKIQF